MALDRRSETIFSFPRNVANSWRAPRDIPAHIIGSSLRLVYAIAKVFERFDSEIYSIGFIVSGHTLKHLAAAAACFAILRHFQVRRLIM